MASHELVVPNFFQGLKGFPVSKNSWNPLLYFKFNCLESYCKSYADLSNFFSKLLERIFLKMTNHFVLYLWDTV